MLEPSLLVVVVDPPSVRLLEEAADSKSDALSQCFAFQTHVERPRTSSRHWPQKKDVALLNTWCEPVLRTPTRNATSIGNRDEIILCLVIDVGLIAQYLNSQLGTPRETA